MARILLSAYACEPNRGSEPAVGWNWAVELARLNHRVWVLTRAANRDAIERQSHRDLNFIYYDLPRWMQLWREHFAGKRLYYVLWQWGAVRHIRNRFPDLPFDVVHHVTYVSIRYPSFLGSLGIPFYFGPVSGAERIPPKLRAGLSIGERWRGWLRDVSNRLVALDPLLWCVFRRAEKIMVTPDTVSLVPQRWRHKCDVHLAIGLSGEYLDRPTVRKRCRGRRFRLLFVGRLLESKGIDIALRVVRQLREWGLDVSLTIVGDGPARTNLICVADTLQISDAVEWTGSVSPASVEDYYRAADLFLFPSLRDSGGMAVLEALAHGLPVVCAGLGGPGAIVNWRCGRVVPALEAGREELAAGFACAASEILTTPGLHKWLSAGAKARAQDFNFQELVNSVYPSSRRPAVPEKYVYPLHLGELVSHDAVH